MRRFVTSALFVLFASGPALADQQAPPPPKAEEAPKCLVTKAGEKDVTPPAAVDYTAKLKGKKATPVVAKALCKRQAVAVAAQWGKTNGLCDKAQTFKFTATLGKDTFANLNATCPK